MLTSVSALTGALNVRRQELESSGAIEMGLQAREEIEVLGCTCRPNILLEAPVAAVIVAVCSIDTRDAMALNGAD